MGQEPVERVHHPLDRRPNPPSSRLERDFCRRRLARQKGPEDDVSAQRPEIRDHHTREMAAKTAFLLASYQLRVSEDWGCGFRKTGWWRMQSSKTGLSSNAQEQGIF